MCIRDRSLTAWDLTGLGIGAIIGTGIFVLIGTAIVGDAHRPGAGPGIMLSFILSGITCALAALCYAEFAAMIPVAGSAYTYSYATLGEFLAWLTGWNLILEYGVACVAVAIGWSGYFNNCLLYTSDAADERSSVDLGGRRIIKKKTREIISAGERTPVKKRN